MKPLRIFIAILLAIVSIHQAEAWPVSNPEMVNVSCLVKNCMNLVPIKVI